MPYISRRNNLILNHRQHKKDLLRCLKIAEAQGQILPVFMCMLLCDQANAHIPCSYSENSSSSRCSASKQKKVRLVGEKSQQKTRQGLRIKNAGTPVFVSYICG